MITEFNTFRINKGKEGKAKEWMKTLLERKDDCIKTLTREKMALEAIFMTEKNGYLYLSWFSIQGKDGASASTSEHEIDKIHRQFWHECIDITFEQDILEHVVTFAPDSVQYSIDGMEKSHSN